MRNSQDIIEICEKLGGIALALAGDGSEYAEIRVACCGDPYGGQYRANYIRHRVDGGFVYGGQAGCVFSDSAEYALVAAICSGLDIDGDIYDTDLPLIGMRELRDPNRAELVYGSEAWDAYNYGVDID